MPFNKEDFNLNDIIADDQTTYGDVTDSLASAATFVAKETVKAGYHKIVDSTNTNEEDWSTTEKLSTFGKGSRWLKLKTGNFNSDEITSDENFILLRDIVELKKKICEKYITENKRESFIELIEKIWEKKYEKICKEALTEEHRYNGNIGLIEQAKKILNKEETKNLTSVRKNYFVEKYIELLEEMGKTNTLIASVVEEYNNFRLVQKYDAKKLSTGYADFFHNKKDEIFEKLGDLDFKATTFEDKEKKMLDSILNNKEFKKFISTQNIIDEFSIELKKYKEEKRKNSNFKKLLPAKEKEEEFFDAKSSLEESFKLSDVSLKQQEENYKKRVEEILKKEEKQLCAIM